MQTQSLAIQASAAANLLNNCIQVLHAKPSSSPNVKTRTQRFCKLLQISWTFACLSFCCCKSLEKENIYIQILHAKLIITSMCKPPNSAAIRASAATNLFNIRIQVLARQAHHHQMCTNHQTQQQCKQASAAANLLNTRISIVRYVEIASLESIGGSPHSPKTQLRGKRNNRLLRESMSLGSSRARSIDRSFVKPRKRVRPRDFLLLSLLAAPAIIHGTLQSRHVKQARLQ